MAPKRFRSVRRTTSSASGGLVNVLGNLAVADPGGPSILNGQPFNLPGYTNREAALLVGEATFAFQGGLEPVPFYHHTGGTFLVLTEEGCKLPVVRRDRCRSVP